MKVVITQTPVVVALTGLVLLAAGCTAPSAGLPANVVKMNHVEFEPAELRVAVGTTVTWTNEPGGMTHTVTSDDPAGPLHSGEMAGGATWTFTFTTPGTYKYHCDPHASMQGGTYQGMIATIIVQ